MEIQLQRAYKSMEAFQAGGLPDFAVLIGRNGAGKTQLLEALEQGAATIHGIDSDQIELRNLSSFRPPNTNRAGRNPFALNTADAYLLSQSDKPAPIKTAATIFNEAAKEIEQNSGPQARDDFERALRDELLRLPNFVVFGADNQDSPYMRNLYVQVLAPLSSAQGGRTRSSNEPRNSFNGNAASLLSAAMKLAGKLPHELTRTDIMHASHLEGDTLSNSISEAFATYKIDQCIWAYQRFENAAGRVNRNELIGEYQTQNPPPWQTLRRILSEMRDAAGDDGLFNFEFSDPSRDELSVSSLGGYTFTAVMTNRTSNAQYELDSLSSGEKILMALCLVSFNQYLGRPRPKLLLLDELDTVLHPSMVKAAVTLLKNLFASNGTRVLMTSHSPITVAALDEDDIFRVVRTGGNVEVSPITKLEAIDELSEGLATVDVGLRIAAYDEAKVTILTEGHNSKHLKRWVKLNFPKDVRVLEGFEDHTNDVQLLAYGRLLAKMRTNTHFVIVWDCDAAKKAEALDEKLPKDARITPYAFPERPGNPIADKGIENNYDEQILEPYSTTTRSSDGTVLGRGFQNNRKTEFAEHVLQCGTDEYFTNLEDLHDIVCEILDGDQNPPTSNAAGH